MTLGRASIDTGSKGFSQAVASIASAVKEAEGPYRNGLSRGDRGELRRMTVTGRIPPEAYWQLVRKHEIMENDHGFWRSVIPLMVRHPHSREASPGQALAKARVAPSRVERWLRQDRAGGLREAGRLFSKVDTGFNWVQLAWVLRAWNDESRLQLAKDFYLSPEMNPKDNSSEEGEN